MVEEHVAKKFKRNPIPYELFDVYARCVPVAESIIECAQELYKSFFRYGITGKFYGAKQPLVAACIFFASHNRNSVPIKGRKLTNAIPGAVSEAEFNNACSSIRSELGHTRYKQLFNLCKYDITNDINQLLPLIRCFKAEQSIVGKVHTLYDALPYSPKLDGVAQDNIVKSLIYIVARAQRFQFTLQAYAKQVEISPNTITKLEGIILDLI